GYDAPSPPGMFRQPSGNGYDAPLPPGMFGQPSGNGYDAPLPPNMYRQPSGNGFDGVPPPKYVSTAVWKWGLAVPPICLDNPQAMDSIRPRIALGDHLATDSTQYQTHTDHHLEPCLTHLHRRRTCTLNPLETVHPPNNYRQPPFDAPNTYRQPPDPNAYRHPDAFERYDAPDHRRRADQPPDGWTLRQGGYGQVDGSIVVEVPREVYQRVEEGGSLPRWRSQHASIYSV
ncbi:hypothetical protein BC829DRAFT_399490, partial [Chytridium lagenaria]